MVTIRDLAKRNNFTTIFSGGNGLRGYKVSDEVHEHLTAIQEGKLIVAFSPEYGAYEKHAEAVFKNAFYCLPNDLKKIKVQDSNYYNIHQKGYVYLYEAIDEIGQLLYADWTEKNLFLKGFNQSDDPLETEGKTKIIYDASRRSFLFCALDIDNKSELNLYYYETYQDVLAAKETIYRELHQEFVKNIGHFRYAYNAYKQFIDSLIALDIQCYALLSDKENDKSLGNLRNEIIKISQNEWLTKKAYPEDRIIRHKENKILLGVIDAYHGGDTYKGISLIKRKDVDKILAALKGASDSLKNDTPNDPISLGEGKQIEQCKAFILSLAHEQKDQGQRPMIDDKIYSRDELKLYCKEHYPKVITARFDEIWKEATKFCPHWAKVGRILKKSN